MAKIQKAPDETLLGSGRCRSTRSRACRKKPFQGKIYVTDQRVCFHMDLTGTVLMELTIRRLRLFRQQRPLRHPGDHPQPLGRGVSADRLSCQEIAGLAGAGGRTEAIGKNDSPAAPPAWTAFLSAPDGGDKTALMGVHPVLGLVEDHGVGPRKTSSVTSGCPPPFSFHSLASLVSKSWKEGRQWR